VLGSQPQEEAKSQFWADLVSIKRSLGLAARAFCTRIVSFTLRDPVEGRRHKEENLKKNKEYVNDSYTLRVKSNVLEAIENVFVSK
jgi:hypothetical protein